MPRPRLLLAALAFAASLSAQQPIAVPDGYLTKEGSGATSYPFGLSTPCRLQLLYGRELIGAATFQASQVAFRADGNTAVSAKSGIELTIGMTHSPKWIGNADPTFANNLGNDYTIVFTKKLVNLPQFPGTGAPQPFLAVFKLDTPFVFVKTLGNPLVDFVLSRNAAGAYSHDTEFLLPVTKTPFGQPCGAATQSVLGGTATDLTSTTTFHLAAGPAGGIGVHVLGADKLPTPIPLPFGGCRLYVGIFLLTPALIDAAGAADVVYPTPVGLRGVSIFGQWVAIDVTGPKWLTTEAHEVDLGGYLPYGRIYHLTSDSSPTGTVQIGSALVLELR